MWIMTNYGILMPAAIPSNVQLTLDDPTWDLQVRSRDRKTLQKCLTRYMRGSCSQIVATPELDYNFRFYCGAEDFTRATAAMVLEIDYTKFKPTTERKGNGGKRLHELYNRIWNVVINHYDPLPRR